jgi:choice-of-anchor B domain-containing protein
MLTVALAVLCISASLYAVPLSVLNDPNWDNRNQPSKETQAKMSSSPEEAEQIVYETGDTAHYMCDKGILSFSTFGGTGCWGYRAPDGTDYAIMGVSTGIAVVNTSTMTTVGIIPGPTGGCGTVLWREMRVYNHYAYAVSECTGTNAGLMVINLGNLPTSVNLVGAFQAYPPGGLVTSHSLDIDTTNGYAYLEGTSAANNSIRIHNLANPAAPVYVNSFGIAGGIHDCTALDDTLYVAEGSNLSIGIYNMANKMAPALITRIAVPGAQYIHNIWPSDNRDYLVATDELGGPNITMWNISDLGNVQFVDQYNPPDGLTHNAYWKGDRIYFSHYEAGMKIFDASDPENLVEILNYDTWPTATHNFNGMWGGFPYTNSGNFFGSNLDGKLYVLEERNDILNDTMWADTTVTAEDNLVEVTIYATNSHPIRKFQIPLNWVGPSNMDFVSTSRVGTRTDYFQSETYPANDLPGKRLVVSLTSSTNNTAPDLPAGSGPILKVTFSVPSGTTGTTNPVTFAPFVSGPNTYDPGFITKCITVHPDTTAGEVQVAGCCVGIRGDVNSSSTITVADLTFLVQYLFNAGAAPSCVDEANVNGVGGITVADLTYLVQFLFNAGAQPPACP